MSRQLSRTIFRAVLIVVAVSVASACASIPADVYEIPDDWSSAVIEIEPIEEAIPSLPVRFPGPSTQPIPPGQLLLPAPRVDDSLVANRPVPDSSASLLPLPMYNGLHEPMPPVPLDGQARRTATTMLTSSNEDRPAPAVTKIAIVGTDGVSQSSARASSADTSDPILAIAPSEGPAIAPRSVNSPAPTPVARLTTAEDSQSAPAPPASRVAPVAVPETVPLNPAPLWFNRHGSVDSLSDVRVVLPGTGWLYVGREESDGVPRLVGKSGEGIDDTFEFSLSDSGNYRLWFQQQDPITGSLRNERLLLTAQDASRDGASGGGPEVGVVFVEQLPFDGDTSVGPGAPANIASWARPGAYVAPVSPGDVAIPLGFVDNAPVSRPSLPAVAEPPAPLGPDFTAARQFIASGDPSASLRAYLAETDSYGVPDDVSILGEIAEAAMAAGNRGVAREYWRLVADQGGSAATGARRRLWGDSLSNDDQAGVILDLAEMVAAGEALPEDHLVAARRLDEMGVLNTAIEQFDTYLSLEPRPGDADGVYFRLAQLLEMPTARRDLKRAIGLYELVVREFPLSQHWEKSESRIEYLNRHFFDVR